MRIIFLRLIFLCLMVLPVLTHAQTKSVHGIVRDSDGPMIGTTVCILNADGRVLTGVTTNANGEYFLKIPEGLKSSFVEFSFIGYKSQRIPYKGQEVLNVTLVEEVAALDEVTVSAKRVERNSMGIDNRDLGVARQKIDLDEFQDMPITSVEDMLQGKLANVDILASSGDPGARSSIRIRGTSSLNASNEPLIVIDDVPYETEINEDFEFATATDEDFGALVNIAPSDIASIEVLKDAAATALWGSKAANGVLLITTKRGEMGKPRFSITQKFNFKKEPRGIPMLNADQYVAMMQDGIWNAVRDRHFDHSGNIPDLLTKYPDIRYDESYAWYDEFNQNTDWLDMVTQNAFTSETNFSMSGGGNRATYRFSAGYLSEGGTTIGTGLKRITTRLNVDYKLSQKLRLAAAFSYAESDKDANWNGEYKSGKSIANVRTHARNKMPNMSCYVLDKDGNPTNEYFTNPTTDKCIQGTWGDDGQYNPVAMAKDAVNNTVGRSMRVSFNLKYNMLPGLQLSEDLAFDLSSTKNKKFLPNSAIGVNWTDSKYNRGEDNMSDAITLQSNTKLIYNRSFAERHHMILTGMAQIRDYNTTNQGGVVSGLGSQDVSDPTAGGIFSGMSSGSSQNRSVGFLAQGHYNFDERYMVTLGVRYDGNSKIGKNERFGAFPSVQAVWRLSNEWFLKEKEWIEEIKLRGSWGQSGNSPSGNYTYIGKFESNGMFMDKSAIKPSSVQLNNLKWEVTTQWNGGLDIHLLDGKVSVVLEYYKKTTDDLLQTNVGIPTTSGFDKLGYMNSGKVENKGWEIMIDLRNIVKVGDFAFGITNLNLSRNRNRVLELPSNLNFDDYTFGNGNYARKVIMGNPMGSIYGYRCLGVYQNLNETLARDAGGNIIHDINGEEVHTTVGNRIVRAGDAKYEDTNHDGVIDKYDIVYLGNSMPILTGGGSLNFTYKGLRLRASFQTRIGQSVINRARMNSENMRGADNQATSVIKRWRHEGDNTIIPRALYGEGYNYLGSDRFVEKASFLRFKDVMLSYNFPKTLIKKWGLTNLSCYFTAYDVWTWSNYKGQDPEVGFSSQKGVDQWAIDNNATPRPIRMALGFTIDL